ncbi:hypothetical protein Bca4012_026007 [Brassica carinata]
MIREGTHTTPNPQISTQDPAEKYQPRAKWGISRGSVSIDLQCKSKPCSALCKLKRMELIRECSVKIKLTERLLKLGIKKELAQRFVRVKTGSASYRTMAISSI